MVARTLSGLVAALGISGTILISPAGADDYTMTTWQWEEPGFGDWWQEVVGSYNSSDTRIDVQQIPFRDYANQLTVRFAASNPPDIVTLPSSTVGIFTAQDWLAPLDRCIEGTDIATGWSSLQSEMVSGDNTIGVLLMGYGFMLFYNQALLSDAGVEVPSSFEAFRQAVAATTRREAGIFGLAAVTTEHPTLTLDFVRFIEWQGGDLVRNGNYNLTAPDTVAALENYRDTVGGNAPLGNNSTIARQLFVDGKAAFLIDGPWMYARLANAEPDVRNDLQMIAAPFSPVLGGAANSIHIPAGLSEKRYDAACDFIRHIAAPSNQLAYTKSTSAPAGLAGVITDELAAELPHLVTINDAVIGANPIIPFIPEIRSNYNEFSSIIQRAALQILSTERDIGEILTEAQNELERAVPLSGT